MTTAVELLVDLGQLLYGHRWRKPLAHDLGKDHKEIWRWTTGKRQIDAHTVEKFLDLIHLRQVVLGEEHKQLHALILRINDYLKHETTSARVHILDSKKN